MLSVITMTFSKKVNTRQNMKTKYAGAITIILIGLIFQIFEIGGNQFAGFPSLGLWIIFTGFIMLSIISMSIFSRKEKIIDERMEHIGYKASRVTTLILILVLFSTMVIDGIYTLQTPYYLYASFLICFYIFTYLISYKIIERDN
jgi:uncharacterized membrane protein